MRIAFGCQARVGKDTACDYLVEKHGGTKMRISQVLYDLLHHSQKTLGFPPVKDRQFLQYIGTNWARAKDPDVWIKTLIQNLPKEGENVFVSDVRFPNELQQLREHGFLCVRILRDVISDEDVSNSGISNHTSETSLLETTFDQTLCNDGSLEDFHSLLDVMINEIN